MYGFGNMNITVIQDELGLYPRVNNRVVPAWMKAEHYQNCESGLFCCIRKLFR